MEENQPQTYALEYFSQISALKNNPVHFYSVIQAGEGHQGAAAEFPFQHQLAFPYQCCII